MFDLPPILSVDGSRFMHLTCVELCDRLAVYGHRFPANYGKEALANLLSDCVDNGVSPVGEDAFFCTLCDRPTTEVCGEWCYENEGQPMCDPCAEELAEHEWIHGCLHD